MGENRFKPAPIPKEPPNGKYWRNWWMEADEGWSFHVYWTEDEVQVTVEKLAEKFRNTGEQVTIECPSQPNDGSADHARTVRFVTKTAAMKRKKDRVQFDVPKPIYPKGD